MFAVVRTGGKQYRVAPGDKIVVEKMDGAAGDRVTLGDVLLAGDGSELKSTDGLKVAAEIIAQAKSDKVTVFKKRRRHNYRRKQGHRQQLTILRIMAIGDHKFTPAKVDSADKAPEAKIAAPAAEAKAESPAKSDSKAKASAKAKAAEPKPAAKPATKAKADAPAKPKAETPSTKNAAPAKGSAKKATKADKQGK